MNKEMGKPRWWESEESKGLEGRTGSRHYHHDRSEVSVFDTPGYYKRLFPPIGDGSRRDVAIVLADSLTQGSTALHGVFDGSRRSIKKFNAKISEKGLPKFDKRELKKAIKSVQNSMPR